MTPQNVEQIKIPIGPVMSCVMAAMGMSRAHNFHTNSRKALITKIQTFATMPVSLLLQS